MTSTEDRTVRDAAARISAGGLVAMPTETVYGLAADATNDEAVARIFEAKRRPQFNPLIVHVSGAAMASRYVKTGPLAKRLMNRFWPGPLTLVLPRRKGCALSLLVSAGLDTVGVRAPNHELAQALIRQSGRPLAAPSANRSGSVSPTEAAHVRASLGDAVDMAIDGGRCAVGVESTIVKIENEKAFLLRPGGVDRETLETFLSASLADAPHTNKPQAPGMLKSHYAPRANVRLNARAPKEGEAFLGFGAVGADGPFALNLSASGDLREAAANLFRHLRALDHVAAAHALTSIAVASVPVDGLGEAINDRLRRAAAPRGDN